MPNKPIRVGITGGIGAGKSIVTKVFQVFGAPAYEADINAKLLLNNDAGVINRVSALLGEGAYLDGVYNAKFVASLVFEDKELLAQLNAIVHPAVAHHYDAWLQENESAPYIVKESALFSEEALHAQIDYLIYVDADEQTRIERVLARDPHRTKAAVKSIVANQAATIQLKGSAHLVINNDESELLVPKLWAFHQELIRF